MLKIKHIFYVIFGFIIFMPVFITFQANGAISFDRLASERGIGMTLPISFFLASLIVLVNWTSIVFSKPLAIFLFLVFVTTALRVLVMNEFVFKELYVIIFQNTSFLIYIFAFISFFKKRKIDVDIAERLFIIYPFIIVSVVFALTRFTYSGDLHEIYFGFNNLIIYNFEQYYAFFYLLLLGVAARFKFIYFVPFLLFSFYVSILTSNKTALLLNIFFIIIYLFDLIIKRTSSTDTVIKMHKLFNFSIITFYFFAPLLIIFATNILFTLSEEPGGITNRAIGWIEYFSIFDGFNIFYPFLLDHSNLITWHNQLIVLFSSYGIVGVFLYYLIFLNKVNFSYNYRMVKISIFLVVFTAGIVVLPTSHPFILIIIAYLTAFYYVASNVSNIKENYSY